MRKRLAGLVGGIDRTVDPGPKGAAKAVLCIYRGVVPLKEVIATVDVRVLMSAWSEFGCHTSKHEAAGRWRGMGERC